MAQPPQAQPQSQSVLFPQSSSPASSSLDSRFSCNICLEAVVDPVVTQCGHLYCWPCLFRWLEPGMVPTERQSLGLLPPLLMGVQPRVDEARRVCPVCKAPCSVPSIVPIYVRTEPTSPLAPSFPKETSSIKDDGAQAQAEDGAEVAEAAVEFPAAAPSSAPPAASNDDNHNDNDDAPVDRDGVDAPPPQSPTRSTSGEQQIEEEESEAPRENPNAPVDPSAANMGIRQRRRGTTTHPTPTVAQSPSVPARPAANSPTRNNTPPSRRGDSAAAVQSTALVVAGGRARQPVAGMLALSFQHALTTAVQRHQQEQLGLTAPDAASAATSASSTLYHTSVPPLHRRDGGGGSVVAAAGSSASAVPPGGTPRSTTLEGTDPDATEFLSRILLLLGSFVILCLLLF